MQIKTIVAAILALTVFAAGAFTARWILGEKHARELAEVRLAGLSAQLSFAGHATEQAAKTIQIERDLALSKKKVEDQHAKEKQRADMLLAENRHLVADLGGMRDPGARDVCSNGVSEDTAAADGSHGTIAGARFSNSASQFLLDFAHSADTVKRQLKSCQAWILELEQKIGFSDRAVSDDLGGSGG